MSADQLLVRAFAKAHPDEVARFIERLAPEAGAEVLAALELESAAEVLSRAVPLIAATTLTCVENEVAGQILEACHPSLAAALLFRMDRATRARLLEAVPVTRAQELERMTLYGPARAGGRLDPRAPAMPETLSVAEVFERLRAYPAGVMHYVYAIDAEGRLTGVINMRELMLAPPDAPFSTRVTRDPEALFAHDPLEVIARHAGWKRNHALPVIDRERRLLRGQRRARERLPHHVLQLLGLRLLLQNVRGACAEARHHFAQLTVRGDQHHRQTREAQRQRFHERRGRHLARLRVEQHQLEQLAVEQSQRQGDVRNVLRAVAEPLERRDQAGRSVSGRVHEQHVSHPRCMLPHPEPAHPTG